MKSLIASTLDSYRRYRAGNVRSKAYKIVRYCLTALFVAYLLTICFPQYLFAHKVTYNNFQVYSRAPFDQGIWETEKLSIEEVFSRDFDLKDLEAKVFRAL